MTATTSCSYTHAPFNIYEVFSISCDGKIGIIPHACFRSVHTSSFAALLPGRSAMRYDTRMLLVLLYELAFMFFLAA